MLKSPYFYYENDNLKVEGVPVSSIISAVGSPAYIYSQRSFLDQLNQFKQALLKIPHLICYSVKACNNTNILKIFVDSGCGLDIVSGGELYRALKINTDPKKIVYSGVGKTWTELVEAVNAGILMMNVESPAELERINLVGAKLMKKVPIAIRVNPRVDANTHPYITTGLMNNKFGIDSEEVLNIFKKASMLKNIDVIGIDCHIGSQLLDIQPYGEAMNIIANYVKKLAAMGIKIKYVDVGGGIGIPYKEQDQPVSVEKYVDLITQPFKDLKDIIFVFEPGRFLTAQAGILITEVQYIKQNSIGKKFVIVDTGMHHLIRPPLYSGTHNVVPVIKSDKQKLKVDIVGPICESTDFIAKDYDLEPVVQGDILAISDVGSYGIVLASNYNSHPRPPEILVDGDHYSIISRRESYADLLSNELAIT